MSELSYLEKLLDGVDVEWKLLGDASFFEIANNGRKPVKSSLRIAGKTPYYGANNIQDYVDGDTHDGEYVLIAEDGSASLERYSIQYVTGKFWANNHVHVVRGKSRVNSRFLYHYLHIVNFIPFLTGGVRAKLTKGQLIEISVPIPCPKNPEKSLAIQSEIVRILDTFTALTAELTAELTARKKQYNYYCDQLLNFDGNIPVVQLSDCCVSISDGDHQAPPKTESGVPFITISNVTPSNTIDFENTYFVADDYYQRIHDKRRARKKDILYTVVGSIGIPVYIDFDMKFAFQRHIAILRTDEQKIIPKYLYHVMRSSAFLKKANSVAVGAAQKTITLSALNKMNIPIPPIGEQERIVNILDKFDTLANSLSEGLPREIDLRQKQYEYYRDMLFSFPIPEEPEA
jgi:type I restriction enzyme S subunit